MILRVLLCLLLSAAVLHAQEDETVKSAYPVEIDDVLLRFFDLLKEGKPSEAVEWICQSNPEFSSKQDAIVKLKYILGDWNDHLGDFHGFDRLIDRKLGDHVDYIYGLGIYKKQPTSFEFIFYRFDDAWMLENIDFKTGTTDQIRELASPLPKATESTPAP